MCPIYIAVILPSGGELSVQLHSHECTIFTTHTANELDSAVHIAWNIDCIANFQLSTIHPSGRGLIASQGAQTGLAIHIGRGRGS